MLIGNSSAKAKGIYSLDIQTGESVLNEPILTTVGNPIYVTSLENKDSHRLDDFKKEVLLQDTQSYRIFAAVFKKRIIMELPEDPMMLYSFINMKLRDFYPSLDALCEDMNVEKEVIVRTLKRVGFEYNPAKNRFW